MKKPKKKKTQNKAIRAIGRVKQGGNTTKVEKVSIKAPNELKRPKFKRLFFDIETSPNVVFSWNIGFDIRLGHENMITERSIICICYKFEGDKKVYSLKWDKGDDKSMILKFMDVINQASEVIGHNSEQYDIRWLRTRCLFHGIPAFPDYQSVDTLKLSRKGFRFNSNKLDYIASFLGLGNKLDTGGFSLWRDIVLNNSKKSIDKMVDYCKKDVILLEQVFNKLKTYVSYKTHVGVFEGGNKCDCPECASTHTISNGIRISSGGLKRRRMHCQDCGKYFSVSDKVYLDRNKI